MRGLLLLLLLLLLKLVLVLLLLELELLLVLLVLQLELLLVVLFSGGGSGSCCTCTPPTGCCLLVLIQGCIGQLFQGRATTALGSSSSCRPSGWLTTTTAPGTPCHLLLQGEV